MHTRVSLHLLREKIRYTRTQPTPERYKWRRPHSPQPQRRSLSEIFTMVLLHVPQTPYTNTSNQTGFIPQVLVQYHLQESQQPGIRLHMLLETDIACNLVDAQSTTFNDFPGTKASFRLGWPGYDMQYTRQVGITSASRVPRPMTIAKSAVMIAREMCRVIQFMSLLPCSTPEWRLGNGNIELQDIILLEVIQVSPGSFQPVFMVERPPESHSHGTI